MTHYIVEARHALQFRVFHDSFKGIRGFAPPNSECELWQGSLDSSGYGLKRIGKRIYKAHRLAWQMANGECIPAGMQVLHRCDVRNCLNPKHLFLGTLQVNMADRNKKARHAHGTTHGNVVLNPEQVLEIRRLWSNGESKSEIASRFNVSYGCIREIVEGRNWKHLL